jgi:hypothetical protein
MLDGVAFSPDGTRLALGCADTTLRSIDIALSLPRARVVGYALPSSADRAAIFEPSERITTKAVIRDLVATGFQPRKHPDERGVI